MLFVTGDLHGDYDLHKLNNYTLKNLTRQDYVIIAGDAGIIWDGGPKDKYVQKILNHWKFTTLFVDGNHENFDLLDAYPVETWNGGNVHIINENIIHLMRGQVYEIKNSKIFTMGGATSIDKMYRKEGVSWWRQELPSIEECVEGLNNLEKHAWEVDYIISHDCSDRIFDKLAESHLFLNGKTKTQLSVFFEELETHVKYKHWFFGHYHHDIPELDEKHSLLYRKIVRIV